MSLTPMDCPKFDLRLTPGTDRCQCATCGEFFNSPYAFDKHRTGEHGKSRRCLTVAEMTAAGMGLNRTGYWISEVRGHKPGLPEAQGQNSGDRSPDEVQQGSPPEPPFGHAAEGHSDAGVMGSCRGNGPTPTPDTPRSDSPQQQHPPEAA